MACSTERRKNLLQSPYTDANAVWHKCGMGLVRHKCGMGLQGAEGVQNGIWDYIVPKECGMGLQDAEWVYRVRNECKMGFGIT